MLGLGRDDDRGVAVDGEDVEAIVQFGANLPMGPLAAEAKRWLGKPVIAMIRATYDFVKNDRCLSASYIKELHAALLRSQKTTEGLDALGRHVEIPLIKGKWKMQINYPVRDGVTYAYCPPEQVGSEMDRLIAMHADHVANAVPSEVEAAWLHHHFTQIHPFQDGNGRVARAIASLVLVKDGLFPLVVTRGYKSTYLDALEGRINVI